MKDKLGNNVNSDATLEWYLEYTPSFAVAEATSKVTITLLIIYFFYSNRILTLEPYCKLLRYRG
jgi:hypothetical protein